MYKSFKIGKVRFAVHRFLKTAKRLSPVYRTGIRNWDTDIDKNYSLVAGCCRVMVAVDKPNGCCCDSVYSKRTQDCE